MPDTQKAVLIAEIGSVTTRVTLVDMAGDVARMIGRAEVPSTLEPPHENATLAVIAAAAQIGAMTGRRLVDGAQLVMPQNRESDGVNRVVALTSAAGLMGVVIAAVAEDISARSAQRASHVTYTSLLQTISLDSGARHSDGQDTTWIERQVQLLTGLHPDVVVIAGGVEDGAEDVLIRLAHIVGVTALNTSVDADGSQRQGVNARPLIFSGNTNVRERVIEALSGRARLKLVDNVRPALDNEQLNPLRRELSQLYNELVLPRLAGAAALQRLAGGRLYTAAESAALITRFLAALNQRGVIAADVGAGATTMHYADADTLEPVVVGNVGSGFGVGAVVEARGLHNIARWLPFVLGERELMHRLLNKMLRPAVQPATREDLLLDLAVVREALYMATETLRDIRPDSQYDLVIGGGGVLAHVPHPGLAALALLDGLQRASNESVLATELHLDSLGLLAAAGALAFTNAEAALSLVENDLLANTPLATCVVIAGEGAIGERAVDV
ncbi:MAG TPA: glutamate mutase L, partial [Roseiflexaceae bacterium]|nr:glutamate mutase L [Roseiflexaceae bacterium]